MKKRSFADSFRKFMEKRLLLQYVMRSFLRVLAIMILATGVIFGILQLFGLYPKLESRLDLKYDSPWLLVPMAAALALALIAFVLGLILYFYKYKRSRERSRFNSALQNVITEKRNS